MLVEDSSLQSGGDVPYRIELIGRSHPAENADICSEYFLANEETHHDRAVYCQLDSNTKIYYEANLKKWVLNRHGSSGENFVAYADEPDETALHPGRAELQWWVYSNT